MALLFRGYAHSENIALDAPPGVAAGERGDLTYCSIFGFQKDALAFGVHEAEVRLGGDVPLFCRPSMPLFHLGVVLRNLALFIH